MFFDLSGSKITIIVINKGKDRYIRTMPMDVPGRVLGIDTSSKDVVDQYIHQNRIVELICGSKLKSFNGTYVLIRWENDFRNWYSINNQYYLLSTNCAIFRSIWNKSHLTIYRDFRPAHERKPITKKRKLSVKASKSEIDWSSTLDTEYAKIEPITSYTTVDAGTFSAGTYYSANDAVFVVNTSDT